MGQCGAKAAPRETPHSLEEIVLSRRIVPLSGIAACDLDVAIIGQPPVTQLALND
jgi:hypothetical protein